MLSYNKNKSGKDYFISIYDLEGFLQGGVDTLVINNIEDLADSVNKLIASDNMYSDNGMHRYKQNHTAQAVAARYLKLALTAGSSIS